MPPQDRVRCDDARDLTQDPPTQPIPTDRQPASIVIGELEPLSTQLASEDPIFFQQIRDRLAFLAIHPASQDGQHDLESGRVDHGRSLHQGRKSYRCPSIQSWDITGTLGADRTLTSRHEADERQSDQSPMHRVSFTIERARKNG